MKSKLRKRYEAQTAEAKNTLLVEKKKENTILVPTHKSVCKMREAHIPFHSVLLTSKSAITFRKEEKQTGGSSNERKKMRRL